MDECKMCYKKCDDLETRHIKDQQYADENNMIDGHHKNVKHNLVPLCKSCHLKITNGEVVMDGWKETNQGKILIWKECEKKVVNKKFSEDDVQNILKLKGEYSNLSQKDFIKKVELDHNIKLGVSILKKMIDGNY